MNILDYLPEIIFAVLAAIGLIWAISFIRELLRHRKGEGTCISCKAVANKEEDQPPYLFLLPVFFGTEYADEERYLLSKMSPIRDKTMIPTGQRACRVEVQVCQVCGTRQVEITDFLQVRQEESVKSRYVFSYEPFAPLLESWWETYGSES